uniref:Uncharacterized protein n=1 Tax=Angiostrongylus cantonensis TaxID=6313 RepID=A0A0K0CT86_ANGCA
MGQSARTHAGWNSDGEHGGRTLKCLEEWMRNEPTEERTSPHFRFLGIIVATGPSPSVGNGDAASVRVSVGPPVRPSVEPLSE